MGSCQYKVVIVFLESFDFNMPSLSLSTAKRRIRLIFDKSLRNSTAKSAMNTFVYRSLSWSEKRKPVYRMKYLTRGRAVSSHTSVKCDAKALIHECVELRCFFVITFITHSQRERMKLCISNSPLQISTTKLAVMEQSFSLRQPSTIL